MRYSIPTRLLSLILAATLLIPCIPQGSATANELTPPVATKTPEIYEPTEATETTEAIEETEAAEETEAVDVTEATEETEAVEVTEAAEETEAAEVTEPVEETESTEATETTEPVEETESTEATEPAEEDLPVAFPGMPEGYVFSAENQEHRVAMAKHGVLETLSGLIPGENYVENQIMVSAETEEEALLMAQAYGGELTDFGYGVALITLTEATVQEAVAASMDESQNLPVASPNYTYKIDPIVSESASTFAFKAPTRQTWNDWVNDTLGASADPAILYPYDANYQYMHDVVDSYAAWGVNTGDKDIVVAVIDSGVDTSHKDLKNVTTRDVGLGTSDVHGHGTHVAGIISAELGNAKGGVGIAPDVSILGYCVGYSNGNIDTYKEIQAIRDAVNRGAHVINMSLGGVYYNSQEESAVNYAYNNGVTIVAAMGNDGSNTINYPAAYDHVIAVAATDRSNNRAYYSNYGSWCDISAPGSGIYSTLPGDDYEAWDGTSMATPVVTGAIALYMSHWGGNPGPDHIEKVLKAAATKCKDKGMGAGIVNVANMLDDKPDAPAYSLTYDGKTFLQFGETYKGAALPCETILEFATYGVDRNWYILYTLDGKTPSVKNGEVINGNLYDWDTGIDLTPYAGSTVTLKAMQVSGLGLPGKVLTLKLKVADSTRITGVSIAGPTRLVSGKQGQFAATVYPVEKADQDVIWSIESPFPLPKGMKIDKTGKLTTPKNYKGTVTVKAVSAANARYYDTADVSVEIVNPVNKIALNLKSKDLYVGQSGKLYITQLEDSKKNPVSQEDAGIQWTSSNPKVATVDKAGNVKALSKGKATITCKALDGSNKSAKCTVTVKQQVERIEISGNTTLSPRESISLKAAVYPTTANTKTVTWDIDSGSYNRGVRVSTSGKVSVPEGYNYSKYPQIVVYARAKDGMGAVGSYTLTVQPKIANIAVGMREYYQGFAQGDEYNKKGILSTVHLFSVDLNESNYQDNYCALEAISDGPSVNIVWSSSNPNVASVSGNGYITAHKAGTAKITVKALDNSKKSATVTIKVTNPQSYIEIKTSALQMSNSFPYIGIGKSVSNSIVFGNTYGTPSSKAVVWDYEVYTCKRVEDSNGYVEYERVANETGTFRNNDLIKLSNGKVTVKSSVKNYRNQSSMRRNNYEYMLVLKAYSNDGGTGYAEKEFLLIPPSTKLYAEYSKYISQVTPTDYYSYIFFYSDQAHVFNSAYENGFVVTSSNPKVVSILGVGATDSDNWYTCDYVCGQRGTAKITIKATDGSNKSCSFTVKVK